ncbi:hypothetical protein G8759_12690 [Spirosoma aureum]|uniref:DUF4352 domain-containing protein n=1 Tax=Spirosoma aureum TaxID=2692134 RepID=A0A6G9AM62_9BACT|nr:hypothetical protein [Spirosoma aureum]QIP13424.1 hypothetical protein G8759_12690 [Spirosoma aureum]
MKPFSFLTNMMAAGLLAGALSSCAPTVTTSYLLEPVSGDVAMIEGRPVTKAEQNGVGVVASFEREDMEFVTFDIEVKNRTDHPIEVNPADFHFVALGASQDTLSDPAKAGFALQREAADPSYETGRVKLKRKQEEKRLKRAKIFNTVLMVAAIASDVSSSSNSRSYREFANNRAAHYLAYQGIAVKRAIDHSTFADRMQRYDYEEYRWRELALKANTLAPGESVRGFVYVPKLASAKYLAMTYSVSEQATVPVLFKQEFVQQKKQRR